MPRNAPTPRPSAYPRSQAEPGGPSKPWLNARELGRVFDLTGPKVLECLAASGWLGPQGRPSDACLAQKGARTLYRTSYARGGRGDKVAMGHQWHAQRTVAHLEACGLQRLPDREVFVRVVADQVATGLKAMRLRVEESTDEAGWRAAIAKDDWLAGRFQAHVGQLPDEEQAPFVLAVHAQVRRKGVSEALARRLLEATGWGPALKAQGLERAFAEAVPAVPVAPAPRRPRL